MTKIKEFKFNKRIVGFSFWTSSISFYITPFLRFDGSNKVKYFHVCFGWLNFTVSVGILWNKFVIKHKSERVFNSINATVESDLIN